MLYKVLLVDDEAIICDALSKFFPWKDSGFEVIGAANSVTETLAFLEKNEVDIIITDIRMPIQTGIDLLEIVNDKYPYIKTVVLSGYSEFSYAQNAIHLGAIDYLMKPVNFDELKALLNRLREFFERDEEENRIKDAYKNLKQTGNIMRMLKGEMYSDEEIGYFFRDAKQFIIVRISPCNRLDNYEELNELKDSISDKLHLLFKNILVINNDVYEQCAIITDLCFIEDLPVRLDELTNKFEVNKIKLAIGISEIIASHRLIADGYIQAGKALRFQKVRQRIGIVMFHQIDMLYNEENSFKTTEYAAQLMECITDINQHNEIGSMISKIMEDIKFLPDYSLNNLQVILTQIMIEVTNQINNYSSHNQDLYKELNDTLQMLLRCTDSDEVYEKTYNYFTVLINKLKGADNIKLLGTLINDVIQYLNEHYAEQVSLNVLADNFYVHPTYLSRLFKEKTGVNFIDYLTQIRINKAKELLLIPEFKIYDVCFMVGYESPRYFSKIFKQHALITPKEYKEGNLK
ncbi:MAG: response regulator [Acetivibrio sp.]